MSTILWIAGALLVGFLAGRYMGVGRDAGKAYPVKVDYWRVPSHEEAAPMGKAALHVGPMETGTMETGHMPGHERAPSEGAFYEGHEHEGLYAYLWEPGGQSHGADIEARRKWLVRRLEALDEAE